VSVLRASTRMPVTAAMRQEQHAASAALLHDTLIALHLHQSYAALDSVTDFEKVLTR